MKIHWPAVFGAVVVACDHLVVEIELEPSVGPSWSVVAVGFAHFSFSAVDDSCHSIFVSTGEGCWHKVSFFQIGCDFCPRTTATCPLIDIIKGSFWLLCKLSPRDEFSWCSIPCHGVVGPVDGYDTTTCFLNNSLCGNTAYSTQHQQCRKQTLRKSVISFHFRYD